MTHWIARAALATAALSPLAAATQSLPAVESRGQMLYGNHCVACHNSQVHWRDNKVVTDWVSLKLQVRWWQGTARLNWSEDEIDDVARFLNDTYYRLPGGAKVALLPAR